MDKEWQDLRMAVYAAMNDCMDQSIGRILGALEETGRAENTIVMFLSDNGGSSEEYGHDHPKFEPGLKENYTTCGPSWAYAQNMPFRRYKKWMHEGGICAPFIVRGPGHVQPGSITDQVGHILDLLPAFSAVSGTTYPGEFRGNKILPVEGISLLPVLESRSRAGHDSISWEFFGNRAIREQDWKLCWDKNVKIWELYDLSTDRTETDNLAAAHPERVQRMSDAWFRWAKKTGVKTN